MFLGINWALVDWTDVLKLLAISAALSTVLLAAIRFLRVIPAARKKLFYFFALLVVWTPVGLITPGVAYGEWIPEQGFNTLPGAGYLPQGIDTLSRLWKAPFQFYQLPGVSQTAPVSQQAPGYILSAAVGVVLVAGATWLLGKWLAAREKSNAKAEN